VGAEVGPSVETLSGFAAPGDVEVMLQLAYLYFTQPRLDSVAWEAYRERAREAFRDRGATPEGAFGDSIINALTQGHPRARPLTAARIDSLSLGRSFEIFRERFADAGDFTFYLAGSFDPDSIRPLVERYLGGLPSQGHHETARDVGIHAPAGVVRKIVRRGMAPQARTQVIFSGPISMDRRSVALLRTLADGLELRLRERLREDLSGTYGVGVFSNAVAEPRPEFRLAVDFAAAPDRLDELATVLFAELDSVRANGISVGDLGKVREQQRRERELQLRENGFWLNQMIQYDRLGWDLRAILAPPLSQDFTPADLRDAAQRFLDPRRYVQVSLYPERLGNR
jgi:zinc protease